MGHREKRLAGEIASWVLVVGWAAFIFFMSAHTGSDFEQGIDFVALVKQWLEQVKRDVLHTDVDVVSSAAHFCAYLVLGGLLENALAWRISAKKALVFAVAAASLYGVTDEIHQLFVPGRACDPVDWLVDTVGALLGALVIGHLVRKRPPIPERRT